MQMNGKPKEFELTEDLFLKIKQDAENNYKGLKPVHCPYLKDKINFNTKGLDHIKFKEWNKPRSIFDQYLRLKLLYLAPEIIKNSHTVQGIWLNAQEWERQKKHGKWQTVMKNVSYYEFIAVIGKVRLKVIVKQVEGGEKYFWSIIPFWRMGMVAEFSTKKLHDGDPGTD